MLDSSDDDNSSSDADIETLKAALLAKHNSADCDAISGLEEPSAENPQKQEVLQLDSALKVAVFGDKKSLIANLRKSSNQLDRIEDESSGGEPKNKKLKRQPAWHDSDDESYNVEDVVRQNRVTGPIKRLNSLSYSEHLRNKFHRITSEPKWADLDRKPEPDSDDEVLQTVGQLAKSTNTSLPAKHIEIKRLKDLNRATYAERSITAVQFHPTSTVAFVTGNSGFASIYSIDGTKNEKLHGILFKKFPIKCAKLLPSGMEALIGSNKNYYFSYSLETGQESRIFLPKTVTQLKKFQISPCGKYFAACGRFGEVHLFDTKSKELLRTFKQETASKDICFSNDSRKLFSIGEGPTVTIFDIRQQKIAHIFYDDGCINGNVITISPSGRMLATGSNEGVVNVYNYDDVLAAKDPKPKKIIYNLTTSINHLRFNHSSEILGFCSERVKNALKLVHFPTGTVFSNFPYGEQNLGNLRLIEFSPASGYMATGTSAKPVLLFRLKHFNNY